MDNFIDDAAGRRLGNGAKFYGKRKSSFYGDDDPLRKADPMKADQEEDYSGPAGGSYFVLSDERDEQGRPMEFLTRRQAREQAARREDEAYRAAADSRELLTSFRDAVNDEAAEEDLGI